MTLKTTEDFIERNIKRFIENAEKDKEFMLVMFSVCARLDTTKA